MSYCFDTEKAAKKQRLDLKILINIMSDDDNHGEERPDNLKANISIN